MKGTLLAGDGSQESNGNRATEVGVAWPRQETDQEDVKEGQQFQDPAWGSQVVPSMNRKNQKKQLGEESSISERLH